MLQSIMKGIMIIFMAISLWVGYNYLNDPRHFPVHVVKVSGKLTHASRDAVQGVIGPYVEAGLIGMNVSALQASLKEDPWLAEVHVKRVWPDTVLVVLREHHPMAYWGDHAMVDDEGRRFAPNPLPTLDLPHWYGPPDELKQVVAMDKALSTVLAPLGVKVAALSLSARWSWDVTLSSGLHIALGSHDVVERLERFVNVAPFDVRTPEGVQYVDLRYTNGFVVNARKVGREG